MECFAPCHSRPNHTHPTICKTQHFVSKYLGIAFAIAHHARRLGTHICLSLTSSWAITASILPRAWQGRRLAATESVPSNLLHLLVSPACAGRGLSAAVASVPSNSAAPCHRGDTPLGLRVCDGLPMVNLTYVCRRIISNKWSKFQWLRRQRQHL